jgi:hypothetical protein
MLQTISIAETLSMGPQGGDATGEFTPQGQWGAAQPTYAAQQAGQWDLQSDQQFGELAAAWNSELACGWGYGNVYDDQSLAPGNFEWTDAGKVEPQASESVRPDFGKSLPTLASPILVPLPKPLMTTGHDNLDFELEMLELSGPADPPGLPPSAPKHVPTPALTTTFHQATPFVPRSQDLVEPPPGLMNDREVAEHYSAVGAAIPRKPAESLAVAQGMCLRSVEVDGSAYTRVEWLVEKFCAKLQPNMGRPLVSPPFAACGLPNLRLMIFPDTPEAVKNARSRDRKNIYANVLKKGPLSGSLKLKADALEGAPAVITFNLTVGPVRVGPVTYDFSEQAVHGVDNFNTDWLKHVDASDGSLSVGIEILEQQA